MDVWMIIIMSIMLVLVVLGYFGENKLKKSGKTDDKDNE